MTKEKSIKIDSTYKAIRNILLEARANVARTVNFTIVQSYWHIGRLIVEEEQKGKKRADYGKELLEQLSKRLTKDFGKGFTLTNLRYFRQFYLTFQPIHHAVRDESNTSIQKHHSTRDDFEKLSALRRELTWTHYRLIMRIENPQIRDWYVNEAAECNWSTRALERQISSFYYERILASKNKKSVRKEAENKTISLAPENILKDPYVLEFLDLKDRIEYHESDLENALIDKLQEFLLELGKGFSFVARQKRITAEDEDFYIDLVFYNYLLKCFVLIDLKIGKLTHQDIGQMDMYFRMYEEKEKLKGDNPTIGLILCSEKNDAVVKYSILSENQQLFASKYKLYLPSEKELVQELKKERKLIEEVSLKQKRKKN